MKIKLLPQAVNFLRFLANKIVELSHHLQHFFTSGSFGVAVYPLLMHPAIQGFLRFFLVIFSALLSFMGVFYIFAEFVSVLFSEASMSAYFKHTILELLLPLGTSIDGKLSNFSPLSYVMQAVFSLQGLCFVFVYSLAVFKISRHKYWLLAVIFALFFTIGMSLIPSSQAKITAGGIQNFGASLTYLFGNLAVIVIGIDIVKPHLKWLRQFSLQAGALGLVCILITIFLPNMLTPVLERISIYSIVIWEILAGIAMLNRK